MVNEDNKSEITFLVYVKERKRILKSLLIPICVRLGKVMHALKC